MTQLKPENHKQVSNFLNAILHRSVLPGISVSIYANGETLDLTAGVSDAELNCPMSQNMKFKLGCLNKFFVAIVVLEFFNKGLIDIEKSISYYLPDLAGKNGDIIKIWNLLSHTAGYQCENLADPDISNGYTWQKFVHTFNHRPILFKPGTVFSYSYSTTIILGKIIEAITQREIWDLVCELIMEPLGIRVAKNDNANSPDCVSGHIFNAITSQQLKYMPRELCEFWLPSFGGPWVSMRDLTKIGTAIVEDSSTFSCTTKEHLLSEIVRLPGRYVSKAAEHPFYSFGLGCARFPNGSFGVRSNICGQCCALRFDKNKKLIISVGINTNAEYIRDFIINKLWDAMFSEDVPVVSELYPSPEIELEVDELVGTYQGPDYESFNISLENEDLVLRNGHSPILTHDPKAIMFTWTKDDGGCITPSHKLIPIPIGFFREKESLQVGLMVGDTAYKRKIKDNKNLGSVDISDDL